MKAKNFLSSAELRNLKPEEIDDLTEQEAHYYFADLRWGIPGKQICPSCGTIDTHYWRRDRKYWRCRSKGCEREFSVTQGTCFQDRKIPVKKILKAIFFYITNLKGCTAILLARNLNLSNMTAWLLVSKIRELLHKNQDTSPLSGTVHVDGAYFCGKRRDANNRRANYVDKVAGIQSAVYATHEAAPSGRQRRKKHFLPGGKANAKRKLNRRVVLVLRELSTIKGEGAVKTRVIVARREHESEVIPFILKNVLPDSIIMSDENPAYNQLGAWYDHKTVQHSVEYQTADGVSNNQAESFNSRLRRAEYGVYHGFRPTYLRFYSDETAWLEDTRYKTMREKFNLILGYVANSGLSTYYRGYCQGNRFRGEILGM